MVETRERQVRGKLWGWEMGSNWEQLLQPSLGCLAPLVTNIAQEVSGWGPSFCRQGQDEERGEQ